MPLLGPLSTPRAVRPAAPDAPELVARSMAGLVGHELLAGGCLPRCARAKRGREADGIEVTQNAAEPHVPRAKRLQRETQMMAQLDAMNLATVVAQPAPAACNEPLLLSPVAAPPLPSPPLAAACNALAVWSPGPLQQLASPPPCDDMEDGAQEAPTAATGGLRLNAVDVLLRPPAGLALAAPRPQTSAGALVVWAGQPNISAVVARAAERCGLLAPPRAPTTPEVDDDDDDDPLPPALPRAMPSADALMAGEEASQDASQSDGMMALD